MLRLLPDNEAREARQFEAFFAAAAPRPRPASAQQQAAAQVDAEAQRQARRRAAADKADQLLKHINTHLKKYEFSGGWPEQRQEADRLRLADTGTTH